MARTGKIARLPHHIREDLNRRLRDGQSGRPLLDWLNALPEFQALQLPQITDSNLSDWRLGGYQEWLARLEKVDTTRELADFSIKLAKAAGGGISEGAAQILAGKILTTLERLAEDDIDPEQLESLTLAISKLRAGDQSTVKLKQDAEALAQSNQKLQLEIQKFQRTTCELFIKWQANAQAVAIANSPVSHKEKLDAIYQLMFPEDPK